jgi:hypothetical protein
MTQPAAPAGAPFSWAGAPWRTVPVHMHRGIQDYVETGVTPGGALRCFLVNATLADALPHFDPETARHTLDILRFLRANLPWECWGSESRVIDWVVAGGWNGRASNHG